MASKDWSLLDLKPFATRDGGSVGRGIERVMADSAGGTSSIRTVVRHNADGSTTMLRTRNGFPEYTTTSPTPPMKYSAAFVAVATMLAEFKSLYMTSGAYVFGTLGGINITDPSLTVEPVTRKSSSVASTEASELTPYLEQSPPADGEVSKIYNHTNLPSALNTPKRNMMDTPPSLFSGLMRRYMQARYGSGRTSLDVSSDGSGIFIRAWYNKTTGVLKFGTDYVFVELTTVDGVLSIRYWKMRIKETALAAGTEAQEILALSSAAALPSTEKTIAPISIATGTPISYGWSFSLTTNCATACVNEFIAGYTYDRRMWRLLSLTFTYAVDTLACEYALTEQVDGTSSPTNGLIWAPVGASTIWYNQSFNTTPATSQDFPVHSYYVGDTLKVVRWKWQNSPSTPYSSTQHTSIMNNSYVSASIFGQGAYTASNEYHTGSVTTHGFYLQGVGGAQTSSSGYYRELVSYTTTFDDPDFGTPPTNGYTYSTSSAYTLVGPGSSSTSRNKKLSQTPLVFEYGENPSDLRPGAHYSRYRNSRATVSGGVRDYESGSGDHKSSLVIPANDCAAVYIGTKSSRTVNVSRTVFTAHFYDAYTAEWYGTVTGGVFTLVGVWLPAIFRQNCYALTNQWAISSSDVTDRGVSDHTTIDISIHAATSESTGAEDSEIFSTAYSSLSSQVQAISSSLFGDMRYDSGSLTEGYIQTTSGYPEDITLFIGAS